MIYFVQPVDGGPVKIGTTENLDARLKKLEASYGCRLVVLSTTAGGRREEAEIHARFSHLRFGRTEQFKPESDLMEFIGLPPCPSSASGPIATGTQSVMVYLSPRFHRLLRLAAADIGISAKAFGEHLVMNHLEHEYVFPGT